MVQEQNITKSTKGKHLTYNERCEIEKYKNIYKLSNRKIAKKLERAPQTIHKEIKDGTVRQKKVQKQNEKVYEYYYEIYSADAGQAAYENARKKSRRTPLWVRCSAFIDYADEKVLNKESSPDAIIGHAKKNNLFPNEKIPCTTTLYNWIDKGYMKSINLDLLLKTKRSNKSQKNRKNKRILGDSIENRPSIVDSREEFGHWEIDTVVGNKTKDQTLLTLTERKTRYEIIIKIDSKAKEPVNEAISKLKSTAGDKFPLIFKSITSDNGTEFSGISELLKNIINVYFAHPYSSWERGTNEKHNGMIRRFIPKGTRISEVSSSVIYRVQDWMNNLPRKILGYMTPQEALFEELCALGFVD